MQTSLSNEVLDKVTFLTGAKEIAAEPADVKARAPFDEEIVEFLNEVSKELMKDARSRAFSDVVTFAFWIRKGSVMKLKERFDRNDGIKRLGKGVAFHIAPSNVPVNFAYSLATGLIMGNANVVRVPSKAFPQVDIIVDAFNAVLKRYEAMKAYVACVRYDRDKEVNDYFSALADERIVWGGDATIAELRKSQLPARAGEITFADRYSIAVIDSDYYMGIDDKDKVAQDFYNDSFFTDQNACTSPRVVVWLGSRIDEAKDVFWEKEYKLVKEKYEFQAIMGVNKLTSGYLAATAFDNVKVTPHEDNLIVRVQVPPCSSELMEYRDNSGYFYECDCKDIMEIEALVDDKRCQTVACIGDTGMVAPLINAGVKGIDRVVPVGSTMDFDLVWDGYDLYSELTRCVVGI